MLNEFVVFILRSKLYDKSTYQGSIILENIPNMYLNQVQMYFGEKLNNTTETIFHAYYLVSSNDINFLLPVCVS